MFGGDDIDPDEGGGGGGGGRGKKRTRKHVEPTGRTVSRDVASSSGLIRPDPPAAAPLASSTSTNPPGGIESAISVPQTTVPPEPVVPPPSVLPVPKTKGKAKAKSLKKPRTAPKVTLRLQDKVGHMRCTSVSSEAKTKFKINSPKTLAIVRPASNRPK